MGWDIHIYVLPKEIKHDTTKEICLDLEYEPEREDYKLDAKLYKIACPDADFTDLLDEEGDLNEYWLYLHSNKKQVEESIQNCKWDKNRWCSKCRMFMHGIYDYPVKIDQMHINHSHSNPITGSDFCIKTIYTGTSTTDLVRCFSREHQYLEITSSDIAYMERHIDTLGRAIRDSDREALQETMDVLHFLKKYEDRDDVVIIGSMSW